MVKQVKTEAEFNSLISSGVVLVDFFAVWCPPCKVMEPIIDSLAEQYQKEIRVIKVDVDLLPAVANRFSIRGIPTFIIFKDGELLTSMVGALPYEAVEEKLKEALR